MADRNEVKIREGKIDDLIKIYQRAYVNIAQEITEAAGEGRIRPARTMIAVNKILEGLGVEIDKWVKTEIPKYYLDGSNEALQDLRKLGVDLTTTSMTLINRDAIAALTTDTAQSFADGIIAMSRSARKILGDALKMQLNFIIAEGQLRGQALQTVAKAVEQQLRDSGLTILRDKSGREWTFENYTDMLVRTKAVEARNFGLDNRMLQNGYDLAQVSNHNSIHLKCKKYEGKILSITGNTPPGTELPGGYTVFATVQQANEDGLFHPRCRHARNVFTPELAAKTKAYDNPYNNLSTEEVKKINAERASAQADREGLNR